MSPRSRAARRPKQLAALVLVGALVVGGALGVAFDRTLGDRLLPRAEAAPVPPRPASVVDEFATELVLSAEQRAAVDSILDERHRIMDSIMDPVRPHLTAARDAARRQIRQRLTAEQQPRFDAYLARKAAEAEKR